METGVPSFWKLPENPPVVPFTCFGDENFLPDHAFKGEIQERLEGITRIESVEGISQCGLEHLNSSSLSTHTTRPPDLVSHIAFCAVKAK